MEIKTTGNIDMNTKQNILSPTIDQMRHLQSLGINCDDASMVYHPILSRSEIFSLQVADIKHTREFWADKRRMSIVGEDYYNKVHGRDVPAYTAEDIMRKLPESILINGIWHRLFIGKSKVDGVPVFAASYSFQDDNGRFVGARQDTTWESTIFIQLLYKVFLWCIENKYIKPSEQ